MAGKLIDKIDGNKKSTPGDIERRYIAVQEFRMVKEPDKMPMMVGMAALFNTLSEDLGGFREQIAPGAFEKSLKNSDVRCLWNHDSNHVLGRTASGTLRIKETKQGLQIENDMPDTMCARDLGVSMERGDVNQMSFGFCTIKDNWEQMDGETIRTLIEVELFDVSPVTFPAYPDTQVAMRSLDIWKQTADPLNSEEKDDIDPSVKVGLIRKRLELKLKIGGIKHE